MTFVSCPNCGNIKFLDKDGKVIWAQLSLEDDLILDKISESAFLSLLVGGFDEQDECCEECCLVELN